MIGQYLIQQLSLMRLSSTLCDLELISKDGQSFPVHHIVFVALNKKHFEMAKKNSPGAHHAVCRMVLSQLTTHELDILVQFMYGKDLRCKRRYEILEEALKKLNMGYLLQETGSVTLDSEVVENIKIDDNLETESASELPITHLADGKHVNNSNNRDNPMVDTAELFIRSGQEKCSLNSSEQIPVNLSGTVCKSEVEDDLDVNFTSAIENSNQPNVEFGIAVVKQEQEPVDGDECKSTSNVDANGQSIVTPQKANISLQSETNNENGREGSFMETTTDIQNTQGAVLENCTIPEEVIPATDEIVDKFRSGSTATSMQKVRKTFSADHNSEMDKDCIRTHDSPDVHAYCDTSNTDPCNGKVRGLEENSSENSNNRLDLEDFQKINLFVKDVKEKVNMIMGATGYINKMLEDLETKTKTKVSKELRSIDAERHQGDTNMLKEATSQSQCIPEVQSNIPSVNIGKDILRPASTVCDLETKDTSETPETRAWSEESLFKRSGSCSGNSAVSPTPVSVKPNISPRTTTLLSELSLKSLLSKPSNSASNVVHNFPKVTPISLPSPSLARCKQVKQVVKTKRGGIFLPKQRKLLPRLEPKCDNTSSLNADETTGCKESLAYNFTKNKQNLSMEVNENVVECERETETTSSTVALDGGKSKEVTVSDTATSSPLSIQSHYFSSTPNESEPSETYMNTESKGRKLINHNEAESVKNWALNENISFGLSPYTSITTKCDDSPITTQILSNSIVMAGIKENTCSGMTEPESHQTLLKETRTYEYPVLHKMLLPCPVKSNSFISNSCSPATIQNLQDISVEQPDMHLSAVTKSGSSEISCSNDRDISKHKKISKDKFLGTEKKLESCGRSSKFEKAMVPLRTQKTDKSRISFTGNERKLLPKGSYNDVVLKSCPVTLQMAGSNQIMILPVSNSFNAVSMTHNVDAPGEPASCKRKRHKSVGILKSRKEKKRKRRKSIGGVQTETAPVESRETEKAGHCGAISASECHVETESSKARNNVLKIMNHSEEDNIIRKEVKESENSGARNTDLLAESGTETFTTEKHSLKACTRNASVDEKKDMTIDLTVLDDDTDSDNPIAKFGCSAVGEISRTKSQSVAVKSPVIARLLNNSVKPVRFENVKRRERRKKRLKKNKGNQKTPCSSSQCYVNVPVPDDMLSLDEHVGTVETFTEGQCSEDLSHTAAILGSNSSAADVVELGQNYTELMERDFKFSPCRMMECNISDNRTLYAIDSNQFSKTDSPYCDSNLKLMENLKHCSVAKKIKMKKRTVDLKGQTRKFFGKCVDVNESGIRKKKEDLINAFPQTLADTSKEYETSATVSEIDKTRDNQGMEDVIVYHMDEDFQVFTKNMFSANDVSKDTDSEDYDSDTPLIHLKTLARKQSPKFSRFSGATNE